MTDSKGDKGVLLLNRVKGHPAADDLERVLNHLLDRVPEAEVVMETTEDSLLVFPTPERARRFAEQLLSTLRTATHNAPQATRLVIDHHAGPVSQPDAHLARLRAEAARATPGEITRARADSPSPAPPPPQAPAPPPQAPAPAPPPRPQPPAPEPPQAPHRPSTPAPGSPASSGWFNRSGGAAGARPNPFSESTTASLKPTPSGPPPQTPLAPAPLDTPPDTAPEVEPPPEPDADDLPEDSTSSAPDTPGVSVRLVNPTAEPAPRGTLSRSTGTRRLLVCTEPRLTLGRSRKECDIVTWVMPRSEKNDELSRMVSSVHCRLLLTSDAVVVKHLSSVNPTHVNGARISKPGMLPLDRPTSLTLSANFSLQITPLKTPAGFAALSEQWCDVISEAGRRRWEWAGRFGVGGFLLERRDGLTDAEAYLWLLAAVALREDLSPSSDGAGCGLCLGALPWVALGNASLEGVRMEDAGIPEGSLALLTPPARVTTPRGDLTFAPYQQDFETHA